MSILLADTGDITIEFPRLERFVTVYQNQIKADLNARGIFARVATQ